MADKTITVDIYSRYVYNDTRWIPNPISEPSPKLGCSLGINDILELLTHSEVWLYDSSTHRSITTANLNNYFPDFIPPYNRGGAGGGGGGGELTPATPTTLGGVKIGDNINVTQDGTISVDDVGVISITPGESSYEINVTTKDGTTTVTIPSPIVDTSPTTGNTDHLVSSDGVATALSSKIEESDTLTLYCTL